MNSRNLSQLFAAAASVALFNCVTITAVEGPDSGDAPKPDEAAQQALAESAKLEVEKDAKPDEIAAPGGQVEFRLKIENEGRGAVSILSVKDSVYGDVTKLVKNLVLPLNLPGDAKWEGAFTAEVKGTAGQVHTNVVTVVAKGTDGKEVSFTAKTTVKIEATESDDDDDEESPDDKPEAPGTKPPLVIGASIGDRVWIDANKDGLQSEGEVGLKGVAIQLLSGKDDQVLAETVSGTDGKYSFKGDYPEKAYLKVKLPAGYVFTARRAGENRAIDNDIDPASGKSKAIELSKTEIDGKQIAHATDWDIGLVVNAGPSQELGVVGPGFWKNHLDAWPVAKLTIGGKEYTKEEAAKLITNGSDKSYTLFRSVVTAMLNIASGAPGDCITEPLSQAQAWIAAHGPGSGVKANQDAWGTNGLALNKTLEDYNEGRLCAPKRHESKTPVSIKPGKITKEDGKTELQLRVSVEKGRTVVLQKSTDLKTWVDVQVLENLFGVSDALRAEILNDTKTFYRVVFPSGPAEAPKGPSAEIKPFRQVGNDEQVQLLPIVYQGSLHVSGNNNRVTGTLVSETSSTVIAGDLIITGNNNKISKLTVLGKVVLRGNLNELTEVDYETVIEDVGNGNNRF